MAEKVSWKDLGEDEWYDDPCLTNKQKDAGNYATVCDDKSITIMKSNDYKKTGKCNFYTIEETFFTAPAVMAYQVGAKHALS